MGPLSDLKIIELAGLGPGPYCAMLLADLGATVIRVERPSAAQDLPPACDVTLRNRVRMRIDLKAPAEIARLLDLIATADGLIEGFRPGVTERLGLGPDVCGARNPQLVYGRLTGWGQEGPLARAAGHDLNYIAIAGALHHIGRAGAPPTPPINLLGDYAGGSLFAAIGLLAGIMEARRTGRGQTIDVAMVDGAASLMSKQYGLFAADQVSADRGTNLLDGGAYFYDSYICADGEYLSIAPIEPAFHALLFDLLGMAEDDRPRQNDAPGWAAARVKLAKLFLSRPRAEWCALLEGTDACVAPVLSMAQAPQHPHIRARDTLIDIDGVWQPSPAPRFSATPPMRPVGTRLPGVDLADALSNYGCDLALTEALVAIDARHGANSLENQ